MHNSNFNVDDFHTVSLEQGHTHVFMNLLQLLRVTTAVITAGGGDRARMAPNPKYLSPGFYRKCLLTWGTEGRA